MFDTLTQIQLLESLGDLPATVIASDRWIDQDAELAARRAEWSKRLQRNWLAVSTNSQLMIIPGSDDLSLLSNQKHANTVADAIATIVRRSRKH